MTVRFLPGIRAIVLVLVSLLVLAAPAARAQVPQTISYQGSLTDAGGAPVSGAFDIAFSLYDAAVAGSQLWTETQSVTLANGAFSVVFGADGGNPLDPSVFENQTYLGLQVVDGPGVPAPEPEMTPRQALTAVGYAFRAKTVETDTLNALSCAAGEVAKWNGAAWACAPDVDTDTDTLYVAGAGLRLAGTTFAVDTGGVTSTMIAPGAVDEGKLGFDTATQAELDSAVSKIGPHVTSVDGLSGGTISSGVAVSGTVSATDLAVSSTALVASLNADRLDSLEASEIIDAAADEVRSPISALPFTISAPGSYFVTGDLTSASSGISVEAGNVTIDLMGYTLNGPGPGAGNGIDIVTISNVEIRNGTITTFSTGIDEAVVSSRNHRIIDVRAVSNVNDGISLVGRSHLIKDSSSYNNGGHGIFVENDSTVTGSAVYDNFGRGISAGQGVRVTGSTAYNNSLEGIFAGLGATIVGNKAHDNTFGIFAGAGSTVTGNTAYLNSDDGISVGTGGTVTGNTVHNNTADGISVGNGGTVTGNTAYDNGADGISVGTGGTVSDNTAYLNDGTGIDANSWSTVTNNTAYDNNDGIHVTTGSFVKGNTVSFNTTNGIFVGAVDVVVEENLVTRSTNGILFGCCGGNFYANNRFRANTADTAGAPGQTDGGGNVSF